ncbi:DVU0772 family protein [Desulfolucanica intricata]|uniref:DVU0772 family protein n=1 Tax=Desulfolucanica intricata TaxID=1285191 RepID=UPI000836352C|nr:hypothetical protein [Desulfolucanica intricata]
MDIDMEKVKKNLVWDFDLEKEFIDRKYGYGFVIDLRDETPYLAVYHMGHYISKSEVIDQQPPKELLLEALKEKNIDLKKSGLFPINQALKEWIKENLL